MIGLIPFMSPAYAVIIVILMYFGIKFYVAKRRQLMEQDVGEGLCLECGAKIHEKNVQIVILFRNNSYVVLKTENPQNLCGFKIYDFNNKNNFSSIPF